MRPGPSGSYDEDLAELVGLYLASESIKFSPFRLTAHLDNPHLELSPFYLHYPKPGKPGSNQLPALYDVAARAMVKYFATVAPEVGFDYVAGVPYGAVPLAERFAASRSLPLVSFSKTQQADGPTIFKEDRRQDQSGRTHGNRLLIIDDHTSGGRHKLLIRAAAEEAGFVVTDMMTVIDRQQGGVVCLQNVGVKLHSLLHLDKFLDIMSAKIMTYIARNQLWTPGSGPKQG